MAGMRRRRVQLTNEFGLHLRMANRLVQCARQFQSEVRVLGNGRVANGKSILDLMALGAESGATLDLEVSGSDSEEAAAALYHLVASRFQDHGNGCEHTLVH